MSAPLVRLVRPSAQAVRPPVLVLLHGVGSNEADLFGLADAFDPRWLVVSVRAPLVLRPGSYAWFPVQFTPQGPVADAVEAEESRRTLVEFLKSLPEAYGSDPEHVVVAGFSQGAIMAASLALTEPELVSAAVLMSGRVLPEVVPLAAPGPRRIRTTYLVVHGTEDERLPVTHGRATRETLRNLGIEPEYREFAMGHTITDQSLDLVSEWVDSRIPPRS